MTKSDVIAKIGESSYRDECRRSRQDSSRPDYGKDLGRGGMISDVPHQITDLIWEGDRTWREKIILFFDVYDDMPSYGHLMYVTHHYRRFSPEDKLDWWAMVRERLSSDDPALAQPLAYAVWCDFFEDPEKVGEAWSELSSESVSERVLTSALGSSGPVPYPLKRGVYDRLLSDPKWHGAIFESLLHSAFDVFGKIERRDACKLLASLELAPHTRNLATLREKLGCSSYDAEKKNRP